MKYLADTIKRLQAAKAAYDRDRATFYRVDGSPVFAAPEMDERLAELDYILNTAINDAIEDLDEAKAELAADAAKLERLPVFALNAEALARMTHLITLLDPLIEYAQRDALLLQVDGAIHTHDQAAIMAFDAIAHRRLAALEPAALTGQLPTSEQPLVRSLAEIRARTAEALRDPKHEEQAAKLEERRAVIREAEQVLALAQGKDRASRIDGYLAQAARVA